jgi:hypothetical protein
MFSCVFNTLGFVSYFVVEVESAAGQEEMGLIVLVNLLAINSMYQNDLLETEMNPRLTPLPTTCHTVPKFALSVLGGGALNVKAAESRKWRSPRSVAGSHSSRTLHRKCLALRRAEGEYYAS